MSLELLEGRDLLATLSVADAALNEIGAPNTFVTAGSGGLDAPLGMTLGPDGNLYVAGNGGAVRRYNGTTGQYISTFVAQGSGGLSTVNGLAFGPDGNLYVPSGATDEVLRYNGTTGAFINAFVPAGLGGLDGPRGITFGPDGNLYVSSATNQVLRFWGPTTASPGSPLPAPGQSGATFVAEFVPPDSGGGGPLNLIFGPDGRLYVDGGTHMGIQRYDGTTGDLIDTFIPNGLGDLAGARAMVFDQDGRLYVSDSGNGVHRYDAQGNFVGDLLVNSVSGSLNKPLGMTFDAQGALLISCRDSDTVVRYDRGAVVSLSAPSSTPVTVDYTTLDGSASSATDYYAQSGTVRFQPGQTSRRILLATRDDLEAESNEAFSVQLSNPAGGATIADGSAVITILDEDASRQLGIADTSAVEGNHIAHYRGAFVQGIPGNSFIEVAFGPDGMLYTTAGTGPGGNAIDRYDGTTGAFVDRFIPAGRIGGVRDIVFRDGYLYVGSEYTDEVLRFNASTGEFVDVFVVAGSGGGDGAYGMAFGPDTNGDGAPELFVAHRNSFNVVRYSGLTGQPLGALTTSGAGTLSFPEGLTFGPGLTAVYVANSGGTEVKKYDPYTGAFLGIAASGLQGPHDLAFEPDGLLYVASGGNNRIMRFNASGTYVDDYVPAGSGGIVNPSRMAFGPDGDLYVSATGNASILRFGTESEALFTVSLSTPSTLPVTVNYTTTNGTALAGSDYTSTSSTVTFAPGVTSLIIRVPTLNDSMAEPTETFTLNLSNPVGGVIADGQGVGTIEDDENATRFYVVDDASPDRTYEYNNTGGANENYALNSGNTQPRGVATTAAGDKVWVVDANRKVYIYNTGGGLLGSWTAGSFDSTSDIQGIATNGTDIWIVDAKSDKVFLYFGAASRLSGSQTAGSFWLPFANRSPKDIVTDGTYLWVLNDSTTDKVFKYLAYPNFTLQGSWTITGGGGKPTGITLDPTGASQDLWIVDSTTDRVYQYANARSRTSGSQSASATFNLAAGNTNPQGIADPPARDPLPAATPRRDEAASRPGRTPRGPIPTVDFGWLGFVQETRSEGPGRPAVRRRASAPRPVLPNLLRRS